MVRQAVERAVFRYLHLGYSLKNYLHISSSSCEAPEDAVPAIAAVPASKAAKLRREVLL